MDIVNVFVKSLGMLVEIIVFLIVIRVFLNIFRVSDQNPIVSIIYDLTEPIITPTQFLLNKLGLNKGMIDFSPWLAILLLRVVYDLVVRLLSL